MQDANESTDIQIAPVDSIHLVLDHIMVHSVYCTVQVLQYEVAGYYAGYSLLAVPVPGTRYNVVLGVCDKHVKHAFV